MQKKVRERFLELLETDSSRLVAEILRKEVGDSQENFDILYSFCFSHTYPVAMRAAHALQFCCEDHPELINPYLDVLVEKIISTKEEGVRRGFLKILEENADPYEINNSGLLMDKCFEWALSENEKPAIRSYSLGILMKICIREPFLKPELMSVIEIISEDKSAAVRSKAQKVLRKIS
jgi:hypothetical protein